MFLRYFDFWSVIRHRHVGPTCYTNFHGSPPFVLDPDDTRRRAAREGVDGQALEARPAEGGGEALRHGPPGGDGARKNSSLRDLAAG